LRLLNWEHNHVGLLGKNLEGIGRDLFERIMDVSVKLREASVTTVPITTEI